MVMMADLSDDPRDVPRMLELHDQGQPDRLSESQRQGRTPGRRSLTQAISEPHSRPLVAPARALPAQRSLADRNPPSYPAPTMSPPR